MPQQTIEDPDDYRSEFLSILDFRGLSKADRSHFTSHEVKGSSLYWLSDACGVVEKACKKDALCLPEKDKGPLYPEVKKLISVLIENNFSSRKHIEQIKISFLCYVM